MSPTARLRDIGSTYGGLTGKTKSDFGSGEALYIPFLEVINSTRLRGRGLEHVRIAKGERQNQVMRGDLLFNGSSETPDEVALSAVVAFEPSSITYLNSFCFGFRLHGGSAVDSTYLAYFFRSSTGRALVAALAQGATRYNIGKTKFLDLELGFPPIEHQRQVAESLCDADDQIVALQRLLAKKQAVKQGVMQQLLTGKLRLPGFTEQWQSGPLKDFIPFQRGFDLPKSKVVPGPYPVVYSNGTARYHTEGIVKGPGVITGRSGTIGKVHFAEQDFWPHNTALWVTDFTRVEPRFAYFFLSHLGLERFASGSGVPTLNRNDAHSYEVTLPMDRGEQAAIALVLKDMDDGLAALGKRLAKARLVKIGMMQQLLTDDARLPVTEVAV